MNNNQKYALNYRPDKNIPTGLFSYLRMVIRRNPVLWSFLIATNFMHALRYPLACFVMGLAIDLLLEQGGNRGEKSKGGEGTSYLDFARTWGSGMWMD